MTSASLSQTSACAPTSHAAPLAATRGAVARIAAATFLTMVPVTLIVPPLKELIADRFGAATFSTHAFMSINLLGAVLATPLLALLCDAATSRRRLVAAALVVDAALLAGMAVAPSLPMLFLLRLLEGVAHMLALSALMASAADLATPQTRGRVLGALGACLMCGTAAGTRVGGLVWRAWPGLSFEAAACISTVAALFALLALPETARRHVPHAASWTVAFRLLQISPRLWIPLAFTFVERLCVGVIVSSFVLFLQVAHQITPDGRSRLLFAFLGPFALLVYPAGRLIDRCGARGPLLIGSVGFGAVMASYGVLPAKWLPAAMLASGVFSALMFAPTLSLNAAYSPARRRGAAYAAFNAAGSLGMLLGPLFGGMICQLVGGPIDALAGYRTAFACSGALVAAIALGALPWLGQRGEGSMRDRASEVR